MLWSLVGLAPFSVMMSDVPMAWAAAFALCAGICGWRDASRYQSSPIRRLLIPAGRGMPECDGVQITGLAVSWRGPVAFLRWRNAMGQRQRAVFWPDTLDAAMRRELRVAMSRRDAASERGTVAG